ncbi:hypothetical protein CGLO_12840 [Colletotrichum gloeosporioides Cg-14]|uniref:Uncharacterized protein n=1 Tax=Colletotrichum gloeosporioides (strain Cg-14) TaxID=1237896 RepID=T0K7M4_COLGC|nr:hypothetical protein CGLO_12840 [Colletotrichum gloeosporioides Cg-14]
MASMMRGERSIDVDVDETMKEGGRSRKGWGWVVRIASLRDGQTRGSS